MAQGHARNNNRAAYLRARVNGRLTDCLLDSGADTNLIPTRLTNPHQLKLTDATLLAANGTVITVDGQVEVTVSTKNLKTKSMFIASPNIDEVILGRNWLGENNIVWSFGQNTITCHGTTFELWTRPQRGPHCKRCILKTDFTIPPKTEAFVPAHIVYGNLRPLLPEEQWSTTLSTPVQGLRTARTLMQDGSSNNNVRVCNITNRPISLYQGQTLTTLECVETLSPGNCDTSHMNNDGSFEHVKEILNKVDSSVPSDIRDALRTLVESYADVFSASEFDLGHTNIVQHQIDTSNNRPFRQPLRPQARAHLPEIDKMLLEMQTQGVIEPCQSEWASNIVLVKKKDGSIRFCVDYRKLNDLTIKDAYPLPRIDTCLESLSGATWYSTFDLRSGFHQVAMKPEDANKTTFVCHRGTYRFRKMPFGLCNAPATFQRLMDLVMTGLNFETCLVYLDDIIIFSNDLESHLDRLAKLFSRLREADLKLKPSKCQLFQKEVTFLGYTVSRHGVGTEPEKIAAVRDWPTPTNLRQSRAFVGLCQYYRRFVPQFSEKAAPLHALTKKCAKFVWTAECQHSFDILKTALIGAEVLALPKEEGQYILDCDASDHSIGGVLSQIQDGVERPICYGSQLFNKHERNYNVTRKELLAIITFVRKYRQYLLGRPFVIRTDHAALQWLKKTPSPIGQQARWLEILEEFDYSVQHRAGAKHSNADALSRRPIPEQNLMQVSAVCKANRSPTAVTTSPATETIDWVSAQLEDPDVKFVYDILESGAPKPKPEELEGRSADVKTLCSQFERLEIRPDKTLCRKWIRTDGSSSWQRVVPYSYRRVIAADLHKGLNGGHFGIRRSLWQVRRRFYWPGWAGTVRQALMACDRCARFKRLQPRRQGRLQPMLTGEPWERLGIDITGPHPPSSRGNRYILTLIDHFTKWVEVWPIRNQEATTVARVLVDRVFCIHGMPLQILTDRGANFESDLFSEICSRMSIDKVRTTAYKPSTNGNIERFHATLNAILAKWVSSDQRNWDEYLPAVAFAYRTSIHETTGFTPYFLMFGREARVPADIAYGTTPDDDDLQRSHVDFVAKHQDRLRLAFQMVREHLGVAAERRKAAYDLRTRPRTFKRGTFVWCYIPRRRRNLSHKWQSFYDGPFLIVRELGEVNVEIQRSARSRKSVVHIDKLKPCLMEGLRSWLTETSSEMAADSSANASLERTSNNGNISDEDANPGTSIDPQRESSQRDERTAGRVSPNTAQQNATQQPDLPKRIIRKPVRFRDAQT